MKQMFKEYGELAARTWPDFTDKKVFANTETSPLAMFALGLVGEMNEYGNNPSLDELGDVMWYAVSLAMCLSDKHDPYERLELGVLACNASTGPYVYAGQACADVAEAVKKIVFHGKELDRITLQYGCGYILGLAAEEAFYGLSLRMPGLAPVEEDLLDILKVAANKNIEKLRKRYPDGFIMGGGVR